MKSRYNIFYQVHKGLRALLYDTALCLQQTDFAQAEDADQVLEKTAVTLRFLTSHRYIEQRYILQAIRSFADITYDEACKEHLRHEALSSHLTGLLQAFHHSVGSEEKQEIGKIITDSFTALVSFNLDSLAKKEQVINKALWRNFSDEELTDITLRISKEMAADLSCLYGKWILRGMNNLEVTDWLKGIRYTAPDHVFSSLLALAEAEIDHDRWQKIQESLAEGAMLA